MNLQSRLAAALALMWAGCIFSGGAFAEVRAEGSTSSPLKKAGFQSASGKHHMGGLRCDWSSHRSSGQVQKAETRRQMAR